ncbi:MAG: ATP-grasp domain-containing protein [bacterium]
MKGAFVTDARSIASLATVRSLGSRGIFVASGESFRYNYSFYSRYARRRVLYSEPTVQPEAFLGDLRREIASGRYGTVLSFRDDVNVLISRNREEIGRHVRLCLAPTEALLTARDKGKTVLAAAAAGVPTPKTFFPEETPIRDIARRLDFPVLVKPRVSSGARGIEHATDPSDLMEKYDKVKRIYGEPIVQEFIDHSREHLSACFLFNHASRLRASFVYQELRQYPVNGGPATFAVSVKNPDVVRLGTELLEGLGWKGVAHIDFLVDPRDNRPKLLEINPRFWMSLPLAVFCGVDFPYLLYEIALSGDVEPVTDYRAGRFYRWLLPADILWFLGARKSWRNLRTFLSPGGDHTCYAVLSKRDPLPALGFLLQSIYFLSSRSRRQFILNRGWP